MVPRQLGALQTRRKHVCKVGCRLRKGGLLWKGRRSFRTPKPVQGNERHGTAHGVGVVPWTLPERRPLGLCTRVCARVESHWRPPRRVLLCHSASQRSQRKGQLEWVRRKQTSPPPPKKKRRARPRFCMCVCVCVYATNLLFVLVLLFNLFFPPSFSKMS